MKVVILAGGLGSNLEPITKTRPKPMIHICGKPILHRIISNLIECGLTNILLVVGPFKEKIIDYFRDGKDFGIDIKYIEQEVPKGVGDAILRVREYFSPGEYFMLVYSDIIFNPNMFKNLLMIFNTMKRPLAEVSLAGSSINYGNIYMDYQMRIREIKEKPESLELANYVLAGSFILPSEIFRYIEAKDGDFIMALNEFTKEMGIYSSIWEGDWVDIGRPWDILIANKMIMDTWREMRISKDIEIESPVVLRGPITIQEGVTIKAGAVIKGPCFIGRNTFIGNNALVREYTSLGANCVIGFGVELKNSVLMDNTNIGRLSFVGDSVIGEGVKIGAGTMTVNENIDGSTVKVRIGEKEVDTGLKKLGSLIGDRAKIGASNTLLPGMKINPGMILPHNSPFFNINKE